MENQNNTRDYRTTNAMPRRERDNCPQCADVELLYSPMGAYNHETGVYGDGAYCPECGYRAADTLPKTTPAEQGARSGNQRGGIDFAAAVLTLAAIVAVAVACAFVIDLAAFVLAVAPVVMTRDEKTEIQNGKWFDECNSLGLAPRFANLAMDHYRPVVRIVGQCGIDDLNEHKEVEMQGLDIERRLFALKLAGEKSGLIAVFATFILRIAPPYSNRRGLLIWLPVGLFRWRRRMILSNRLPRLMRSAIRVLIPKSTPREINYYGQTVERQPLSGAGGAPNHPAAGGLSIA